MRNKFIIFLCVILSINLIYALPIYVTPLNSTNDLQPSTSFDYTFNWTTNADCSGVILTNASTITTNKAGVGFVDINTSTISAIPNYLCEYKNGVLRKAHTLSDQTFRDIYARNIKTDNATFDNIYPTGDLWFDNSNSGRIEFWRAGQTITPYVGTSFIGTGHGFGESILGIRHNSNILGHTSANGYPEFSSGIGGIIEIWNTGGTSYPLAIRQDGLDSSIVVEQNPTSTYSRNANLIGLDFDFTTSSQPNYDVTEDGYIWAGIKSSSEYSGSMDYLRHNFYSGWFSSISNNENVTAVGLKAKASNTADPTNAQAIIAEGDVEVKSDVYFTEDDSGYFVGATKDSKFTMNGTDTIINAEIQPQKFYFTNWLKTIFDGDVEIIGNLTMNGNLTIIGNINITGCLVYNGGSLGTCV